MKINSNQPISTKMPEITSEDISKETMKDFPDLNTGHHIYSDPPPSSTIGYETPVNDQVYIGKRSKDLETELKVIPEKMKILKTCTDAAGMVYMVGIAALAVSLSCCGLAAMGAAIPASIILSTLGASGGSLLTGALVGVTGNNAMHENWLKYYENRTELDHLRRGELWKPTPSYVAPDPEDDCGVPHSPVEYGGSVQY